MKRILSILIIMATLLTLTACKKKYPPVESTDEESEVIFTIKLDGETYEVKYELYRALFLGNKDEVDGGDASVWSSENKADYILEINKIIIDRACDIFAAFHLADRIGINPYSKDMDKKVEEYIALSVEGNGGDVTGFDGSYDDYLASLKKLGLNYSVQELMIRYSITLEKINEYYVGTEDAALGLIPGEYEYTAEDVREYYFGEDCARILHAYMQDGVTEDTPASMEALRFELIGAPTPKAAALLIINSTSVTPTDLIVNKEVSGITVGRYTVKDNFYAEYAESVFALDEGEVSRVIEVNDGTKGYYVIYKLEKSETHFNNFYDDIKLSYLDNLVGEKLSGIATSLAGGVSVEDGYDGIVHAEISMPSE